MNAGFQHLDIHANGDAIAAKFEIENQSSQAWQGSRVTLGWQLYDPETAVFLSEGEWIPLGGELASGARRAVSLRVELPEEPGHYHVYISARTEEDGWFYARHWPFVLVDATVGDSGVALLGAEVTTLNRLHRRDWGRKLRLGISEPFGTLWRNRRIIRSMVRRELKTRYQGSLGDVAWTLLHPLLLMLTYFFVFGVVLQTRFGNDPSRSGFVLYFLAGMLPWLPFSEAAGRAPTVILEHRSFVKKIVFPVETLPVHLALAGLVIQAFALAVFFGLLLFTRGSIPWTALALPLLLVPQFLLTLGATWTLAALGVYLRDLGQMIGFLLTLLFFLTPICYPESQLPEWAIGPLSISPWFQLVRGYRLILLEGKLPEALPLTAVWAVAGAFFLAGHAVFWRLRKSFPDVL